LLLPKRIHILRKLKYLLSRSHLSKIYKTYILPILEYGCELWDDCCIRDTQKLECLQLEAARIVTGLPIYSSAESLYFETGWSKLEDRRKSRKLNLFYKIENNMALTYLSDCLPTTIGASCKHSNFWVSRIQQSSHSSQAYSNIGKIYVL
jgi:hypothetical protein